MMNDLPRRKLVELVRAEGNALLNDPQRLYFLLQSACPECPSEVVAILGALRQGAPASLLSAAASPSVPWSNVTSSWGQRLQEQERMPPEAEFSRRIALVIGGGSGIGREVVLLLAKAGANVVVADLDAATAKAAADEACTLGSREAFAHTSVDLGSSESLAQAVRFTVQHFGGIDAVVNTAALYPVPGDNGELSDGLWSKTFLINVTGNYLLARETEWVFRDQGLPSSMVLTSSANALVPKKGSEAYDISKTALNHLVRELAIKLSPQVRVNGIAPATVVAGSTMFPRDRVIQSLQKYKIEFAESESTEELRSKLANFYAQRTLTKRPILPQDCAQAIVWLAGDKGAKTTGHIIPVDGGLTEAFLR